MGLCCPLIETEGQRVNLVALVNALWEVTQLYRSSVRDTTVLQDQRRRDAVDMNHFLLVLPGVAEVLRGPGVLQGVERVVPGRGERTHAAAARGRGRLVTADEREVVAGLSARVGRAAA